MRLLLATLVVCAAGAVHVSIARSFVTEQPDDSFLYVRLAVNLIDHGTFSADTAEPFAPTLIRLPGYPLFLAAVYTIAGKGNDIAVRTVQGVSYTATCLLAAMLAFSWIGARDRRRRAARTAFVLAAICPFIVVYAATLLTEALTTFLFAATLLAATHGFRTRSTSRSLKWWAFAGVLAGANVLLRPDAGLFAFGIGLTTVLNVFGGRGKLLARFWGRMVRAGVFSIFFVLVLVPWTIRNESRFGVFQPLAPAHAESPGDFVPHGYYHWLRTWINDPKYIGPMLWDFESKPIKIEDISPAALATEDEKQAVAALIAKYNASDPDHPPEVKKDDAPKDESSDDDGTDDSGDQADDRADQADADKPDDNAAEIHWNLKIDPETDAGFEKLAQERVARGPWQYYLLLPAERSARMWFDTHSDHYPFSGELFPLKDLDEQAGQHIWLPLFGSLTWLYTVLAWGGAMILVFGGRRERVWLMLAVLACVPRVVFFGTLENPEPRYLIELFVPAAILGAMFIGRLTFERSNGAVGIRARYGRHKNGST